MSKPFHNSHEIATTAIGLSVVIAGSLTILVVLLLVILPVLTVEALREFTRWFRSRNQTT